MNFAYSLSHYFFPGQSNNHKAKILHSSSIFLIVIFLVVYQLILQALPITGVKILGYAANIPPDEIIKLTNQKRSESGVSSLVYSSELTEAARRKGEHMLTYDYWAHVAPDGTEPWKFFGDVGYKYRFAGENLARDFSNPNDAIAAWINSSSHRDNLLSTKYKEIGVAVVEGDLAGQETTLIVQLFGTQLADTTSNVPLVQARPQASVAPSPTLSALSPTPIVPVGALISPEPTHTIIEGEPFQEKANTYKVLISPFGSTRNVDIATTVFLLIVMIVDGLIIARRKITRVSGRTFAHLAFLGMILAILLIAKAGKIL